MIGEYRKEQQETIERIMIRIRDLELPFKIQHQNITSIVLSSEFEEDMVDRVVGMFKKDKGL